jgi:hypothetical protein
LPRHKTQDTDQTSLLSRRPRVVWSGGGGVEIEQRGFGFDLQSSDPRDMRLTRVEEPIEQLEMIQRGDPTAKISEVVRELCYVPVIISLMSCDRSPPV